MITVAKFGVVFSSLNFISLCLLHYSLNNNKKVNVVTFLIVIDAVFNLIQLVIINIIPMRKF